mmetsp:Transcript_6834/g.11907  ORF Transcript_6834/g.11907 Transcript_6834/m.11907 type:complete len:393 (+) Transcript_6834:142-1320(+)|eukprot:CAMPEP_0178739278 /NCGR_PEP_ID=MMETSP0744-20121128/3970_1 /TAXON_ID=913974 /ORGANISM="Nitzschia punctata, Strain CCMP561" /LENGTH=392 /DNA_ID=CAMNT_0020391971 /DNA_START=101 /DNA_END=1279 /DNA_ORIENTATION=-
MSNRGREAKEDEKGSCCTWPRIILLIIVLAVAGVLVWKFAPVDEAINSILPSYNSTSNGDGASGSGGGGGDGSGTTTGQDTTSAPVESPGYQFVQCRDGQDCCNGLETICDLQANEVLYATLHNAMATFEDGFLFGPNHRFNLEKAVEAGFRGLNLDLCNCGGETIFCHGICTLGPRDVVEVMDFVNNFLDENPSEVIVFIYQVNNDVDQVVDLNDFYSQMTQVSGFMEKLYVHSGPNATWPTLRELTSTNKRVIMFHYNGPDCDVAGECPDGLHWYYNYASDNPWNHETIASITDTSNSCVLRPNGVNRNVFVGLNNFVSPPSQDSAATLNAYDTSLNYVETCGATFGTDVNFLIADFWSEGEIPRMTQDYNTARASLRRHERTLLRTEKG